MVQEADLSQESIYRMRCYKFAGVLITCIAPKIYQKQGENSLLEKLDAELFRGGR
jgi:hypothetical protein